MPMRPSTGFGTTLQHPPPLIHWECTRYILYRQWLQAYVPGRQITVLCRMGMLMCFGTHLVMWCDMSVLILLYVDCLLKSYNIVRWSAFRIIVVLFGREDKKVRG